MNTTGLFILYIVSLGLKFYNCSSILYSILGLAMLSIILAKYLVTQIFLSRI